MSKKIECPHCGNMDDFDEDIWGLARTNRFTWNEKEARYEYLYSKDWDHDGTILRCTKCQKDIPEDLHDKFLEAL